MHDAKLAAPGYDIYALYEEWCAWWRDSGKPELKSSKVAAARHMTRPGATT